MIIMPNNVEYCAKTKNTIAHCLEALEVSHYEFCMTGSRVGLGILTKESDWDFFTEKESDGYLRSIGFKDLPSLMILNYTYQDRLVSYVMRKQCIDGHVDVQIVYSIAKRIQQIELIREKYLELLLNTEKKNRYTIWNHVYRELF